MCFVSHITHTNDRLSHTSTAVVGPTPLPDDSIQNIFHGHAYRGLAAGRGTGFGAPPRPPPPATSPVKYQYDLLLYHSLYRKLCLAFIMYIQLVYTRHSAYTSCCCCVSPIMLPDSVLRLYMYVCTRQVLAHTQRKSASSTLPSGASAQRSVCHLGLAAAAAQQQQPSSTLSSCAIAHNAACHLGYAAVALKN